MVSLSALGHKSAAQESESAWEWLQDHSFYTMRVLPLVNLQQPSMESDNPDNDMKKFDHSSYELHVRPDVSLQVGSLRFGVSPRFIAGYQQFLDGTQDGKEDSEVEVLLREGYVKWRIIPSLTLSLERKNLQWGSGFLTSPSNPFNTDTGKSKSYSELGGKDFVSLHYVPTDWLAVSAYANWDEGEADIQEDFEPVYALKGELTFANAFLSPVVAYEDDNRVQIGGYGSWTASDALVLFFDCAFTQGWPGRYVENSVDDPFGMAFEESKDDDDSIVSQVLVGGFYTFENFNTLYLEYLYYGPGYSDSEDEHYDDLLNSSAEAYLYEGTDPDLLLLKELATRNLGQAALNRLTFQRRNYLMVYFNRNDWLERLSVTAGLVLNLDDLSSYGFGSLDLKIKDSLRLFTNTLVYSQQQDTEFEENLEYSQTFGLKSYF
jgi:hypothetical protein